MIDLTAHIATRQREAARLAIITAARLIAACPDQQRQWRAMHELRKLQKIARMG